MTTKISKRLVGRYGQWRKLREYGHSDEEIAIETDSSIEEVDEFFSR